MHDKELIIGTRPSKLALWQANLVKSLLEEKCSQKVQIKKITTKGDLIQDRSLLEIGGKGLFLKEIEEELLAGTVDLAVHSMKDVPYELDAHLSIVAMLPREDPTDALLSKKYHSLDDLPQNAIIGTTSLRRIFQIKENHPQFRFENLRGNVDTRLKKLDDGEYDAIILASAGLKRLGWGDRITQSLDIVPAGGQGAIGIECRENDETIKTLLRQLNDENTYRCVKWERYFLAKVQGDCKTPIGCYVKQTDDPNQFSLSVYLASESRANAFSKTISGKWDDVQKLIDEMVMKNQLA